MKEQAAQNQHYVPKFILRKFLANAAKERVSVFQKSTGRVFQTSIANVMGERRFNEFLIDDSYYASFEESACRVEDAVLPAYEALVNRKHLTKTPEEKAMLGLFVAFQMLRTRAYRDQMGDMFRQLREKLHQWDLPEGENAALDYLDKRGTAESHLTSMSDSIHKFATVIAQKDFSLVEAPEGQSFYLGDNPVTLQNHQENNGWGSNLGLSVKGIQIYVPLSSRYTLAAYCPSILEDTQARFEDTAATIRRARTTAMFSRVPFTPAKQTQFDLQMSEYEAQSTGVKGFIDGMIDGTPVVASSENMNFYNGLQVQSAREFIICERSNFKLAKEIVAAIGPDGGKTRFRVS